MRLKKYPFLLLLLLAVGSPARADRLPDIITLIRPSVVAIGTVQKTRNPPNQFRATGFIVGDGRHVITNHHALPEELNQKQREQLAVFSGRGKYGRVHIARVIKTDPVHDLALLRISGKPLTALQLGNDKRVREGQAVAFTGFPIGTVLGLYPVTHRGIVSVISPVAIPTAGSRDLTPQMIRSLRDPYEVFQLDATAYPGNSGSPVYQIDSGRVIGVINSVLVKKTKEAALSDPSGISYAIPVRHVRALLNAAGVK